eukprot:Awhi_evm1s3701
MVGIVIPGTPIALDFWKFSPGVSLYFLSHLHADHTIGLTPSFHLGPIYCSSITKELLLEKFKVDPSIV